MDGNIIILGAPGSGKGTLGKKLVNKYGYELISTGDILRQEKESDSEIGLKIKNLIGKGNLVPDDLIRLQDGRLQHLMHLQLIGLFLTKNLWFVGCSVSGVLRLPLTATAMCSSGFETQNFKYRTNDDSRTNVK